MWACAYHGECEQPLQQHEMCIRDSFNTDIRFPMSMTLPQLKSKLENVVDGTGISIEMCIRDSSKRVASDNSQF